MDRSFIRELVRKVEFGCIENGQPNAVVIREAVSAMDVIFGTRLCVNIPRPKLVLVNEAKNLFTRAYRWDTEPAWEELKIIFGQLDHEPIHRSDDELYPDPQNNLEEIVVHVPVDHNGGS
ncbi:hypothetical protein Salat_2116600 [Sesamum alatum]|uniref:Uncharacterized protein n=1 Tax=Sesamum alatum TaxID=300844 RepID=A0AAE1Y0V3_9LAMI|nr:hypothetical protein Salat_2116600 [Sesamum alatum]